MGFWNGFCILSSLEILYYITLAIISCFGFQDNDHHQEALDSVSVNCLHTFHCISFFILRNLVQEKVGGSSLKSCKVFLL